VPSQEDVDAGPQRGLRRETKGFRAGAAAVPRDYLVEHVPVHLIVIIIHVPSFVIFAVSLRDLFPGAPIHSESSIEVAAWSCDGAQAHHFLNEPLALRRYLPLLSWLHLHRSLAQHIPPFLVNVDPSYFFIQHVRIS
jgi:hypothetical protein